GRIHLRLLGCIAINTGGRRVQETLRTHAFELFFGGAGRDIKHLADVVRPPFPLGVATDQQQRFEVGNGTDESTDDVLDGFWKPANKGTSSYCGLTTGRLPRAREP